MNGFLWGIPALLTLADLAGLFWCVRRFRGKYTAMCRRLEEQGDLYLAKYEQDFQDLMEREQIYHDMKTHLIVLKKYMDEGKTPEARQYIRRLVSTVTASESQEKIGHPVLDYLIHEKRRKAAQKGIQVTEELENLQSMLGGLDAGTLADWCAILGNLWDNAIEGCARTEEPGWIHFSMKRAGNMVALRIRNSCRRDMDTGALPTEKEEKTRHGIGIRSIRYTVEKYYGSIECSSRDGIFEISIVMFL